MTTLVAFCCWNQEVVTEGNNNGEQKFLFIVVPSHKNSLSVNQECFNIKQFQWKFPYDTQQIYEKQLCAGDIANGNGECQVN